MKAVVAQFIFESNTFNPQTTGIERFERGGTWLADEEAVRSWSARTRLQTEGSLEVLRDAGWEAAPVFAAICGSPAGRLSLECHARLRSSLIEAVARALPADGVILHLHGAVCAVDEDDIEGRLVERVRRGLGYSGPLVLSLDLHANVTRRMLANVDAVTAYRTMPHSDFFETGVRAARMVLRGRRPRVRTLAKIAALIPPTDTHHREGRFARILARAREIESLPGIEDVSVFPVQPWLDVPELGSSVVVTGDDAETARREAARLAEEWYAQRWEWETGVMAWDDIRARLSCRRAEPWILVDVADATTGGSTGSSAEALRQLLPVAGSLQGEVLLWVVDRSTVAAAEGKRRGRFRIGTPPVEWEADVVWEGEAQYRSRGDSYKGQIFSLGRTVVLASGRLRVVVSSEPVFGADPALYECVNLSPGEALAVQAKSFMGWRAGFGAAADRGLVFDGPGYSSLRFKDLPFDGDRRARLFPLTENPPQPVAVWQSN